MEDLRMELMHRDWPKKPRAVQFSLGLRAKACGASMVDLGLPAEEESFSNFGNHANVFKHIKMSKRNPKNACKNMNIYLVSSCFLLFQMPRI